MVGEIAILNVSEGDTKLSFDPKNPQEVKRASSVVADMLKRGFAIMVEVGKNDRGPLYQRIKKFDPKTAEYIIMGGPDTEESDGPGEQQATPAPHGRKGKAPRRVPAASATAVAVAPTAGG